jgi:hypothetical protein
MRNNTRLLEEKDQLNNERKREKQRAKESVENLSRLQVARKLGCCVATVSRLERAGKLKPFRLNRKFVRFPASQVEALLAAGIEQS